MPESSTKPTSLSTRKGRNPILLLLLYLPCFLTR